MCLGAEPAGERSDAGESLLSEDFKLVTESMRSCYDRGIGASSAWSLRMRRLLLLAAILLGFALPAPAADDITAAQGVIRSQEEAFSRDDASAAYSYAAPAIREIFPRADIFMLMVQNAYAPVYRHRSFEFGEAKVEGGWIAQRVHIIDANGEAWEALYTLERQPDGSFRITGCTLLKAGQSV